MAAELGRIIIELEEKGYTEAGQRLKLLKDQLMSNELIPESLNSRKEQKTDILTLELAKYLNARYLGSVDEGTKVGDLIMNGRMFVKHKRGGIELPKEWVEIFSGLKKEEKAQVNTVFQKVRNLTVEDIRSFGQNKKIKNGSLTGISLNSLIFLQNAFSPKR